MTQLDVVYRYGMPPGEAATLAIARLREVYGVRRLEIREAEKTVRVEFDATRLTESVVGQLLRRAGLDITGVLPMFAAPAPPVETAPAGCPHGRACRTARPGGTLIEVNLRP